MVTPDISASKLMRTGPGLRNLSTFVPRENVRSGKPAALSRHSKSAVKAAFTRESRVLTGAWRGTWASVMAVKP